MFTDKQELLNTQLNVENPINSELNSEERLVYREQIDNSPFWIIGKPEEGYFLTMGKYKMTENQKTPLDVVLTLENEKWDIIFKLICCVTEELKKDANKN